MPSVPRKTADLEELLLPVLAGLNLQPQTQAAGTRVVLTLVEAAHIIEVAGFGALGRVSVSTLAAKSLRTARLVPTDERFTA